MIKKSPHSAYHNFKRLCTAIYDLHIWAEMFIWLYKLTTTSNRLNFQLGACGHSLRVPKLRRRRWCVPRAVLPAAPHPAILYHDLFRTSTKRALKIRTLWSSEIQFGAPLSMKQSSQVGGGGSSLRPVIFSLVYTIVMRVWLMMSVVPAKVSCLFTLRSADEEEENWPAVMIYRSRFLIRCFFYLSQCEYVIVVVGRY